MVTGWYVEKKLNPEGLKQEQDDFEVKTEDPRNGEK